MIVMVPIVMIASALLWALWPRKAPTGPRKTAIIAAVIPPAVVSIAAVIIQAGYYAAGKEGVSDISNALFIAGLGILGILLITCAVFAAIRKGEIAKGIGFSTCIVVILLMIELGLLEWLGGV
jgi:hypothetical protein